MSPVQSSVAQPELYHEIFGSILDRNDMSPYLLRPAIDYRMALRQATKMLGNRGFDTLGKARLRPSEKIRATSYIRQVRGYFSELLDQWARSIEELLHRRPGRLGDGEHQVRSITVATFESGWRHMDRIGNQFGLLIVDEAHHFGLGMRDEALDMCTAPCRLGLTATPPQGVAMELSAIHSGRFGAVRFFQAGTGRIDPE
jgi:hypothetical protein